MSNCIICMEKCKNLQKLDCSHQFCKECIEKWKEKKMHCPLCRTLIFPNTVKGTRTFIQKDFHQIETFWKEFLIHDRVITFIVNILKAYKIEREKSNEYKREKEIETILSQKIQQYYYELDIDIKNIRTGYNIKYIFWNLFSKDHKKLLEREIYQKRNNLKKKYLEELKNYDFDEEIIKKFKKDTYTIPIQSNNNDKFFQTLTNNNSSCSVIFIPFSINPEIDFQETTLDDIINDIIEEIRNDDEITIEMNDSDNEDEDMDVHEDDIDDIFFDKIQNFMKNLKTEYTKNEFKTEFTFIMKSIFLYNFFNVKNNINLLIFFENYKDIIYKIIESHNLNFCKLVFNQYNELYKLYNVNNSIHSNENLYKNFI